MTTHTVDTTLWKRVYEILIGTAIGSEFSLLYVSHAGRLLSIYEIVCIRLTTGEPVRANVCLHGTSRLGPPLEDEKVQRLCDFLMTFPEVTSILLNYKLGVGNEQPRHIISTG